MKQVYVVFEIEASEFTLRHLWDTEQSAIKSLSAVHGWTVTQLATENYQFPLSSRIAMTGKLKGVYETTATFYGKNYRNLFAIVEVPLYSDTDID